ncbi:hypothetical protein NYO91_09445 [Arhodomonas aquaeolei]|uniref:DUF7424 family protein n=1 Tax=Arhodomonas aquaeolei TaxID=2369 RepID=UPI0021685139|nr:hypothetical protein [Arhodomonas aquaeolei]MCS4504299.1 hypothetical protein [Arhodomonas aquaeolei]
MPRIQPSRMRHCASVGAVFLGALFLVGCKMHTLTEIYVKDIAYVLKERESVNTPAKFKIEMATESKCQEMKGQVQEMMERYLPSFKAKSCISEGMDDYLVAEAKVPVYAISDEEESSGQPQGLMWITVTRGGEEDKGVNVHASLNQNAFRQLDAEMEEQFDDGLDLEESIFRFRLNNDTRTVQSGYALYSYVDGAPYRVFRFDLPERERIEIQPSDVAISLLNRQGSAGVVYFPQGISPQE